MIIFTLYSMCILCVTYAVWQCKEHVFKDFFHLDFLLRRKSINKENGEGSEYWKYTGFKPHFK